MWRSLSLKGILNSQKDLVHLASHFSEEVGSCLLYSGGKEKKRSDISVLALFPYQEIKPDLHFTGSPWKILKEGLGPLDEEVPFSWIGFLSYELGAFTLPDRVLPHTLPPYPLFHLYRHACYFFWEEGKDPRVWFLEGATQSLLYQEQEEKLRELHSLDGIKKLLCTKASMSGFSASLASQDKEGKEEYLEKIQRIKEHLKKGDTYQVNLSREECLVGKGDVFTLFSLLVEEDPKPFSAFMHLSSVKLVSSSPELFLSKKGRCLTTHPIKGTIVRKEDPQEDLKQKLSLLSCPKNNSELVMITDLMRNDLSRVCEVGSVRVPELIQSMSFSFIHHLYSVIEGTVKQGVHPVDILRASFPPGSISGCPKVEAQKIIHALEKRARGVYTGCLGFFTGNGDFTWSVAIRTLEMFHDKIRFQVGGAIVAESDDEQEWEETEHKARSLKMALKRCYE